MSEPKFKINNNILWKDEKYTINSIIFFKSNLMYNVRYYGKYQ